MERCRWLDGHLRTRSFPTAREFVSRFEVSRRTFYRDVEYMRLMLDAPIVYDRERGGYFYEDMTFNLAAVQLTEGELVALLIAERVLRQYEGTPYGQALGRAFEKICRSMTDKVTIDLWSLEKSITFDLGPVRAPDVALFNVVASDFRESTALRIRYDTQSRDRVSTRIIEHFQLHNSRVDSYLIPF